MTKPKPWKPYDVEQAKADIEKVAERAHADATYKIEQAALAATDKLIAEAATFRDLPRDLPALFSEAQHVTIAEMDTTRALDKVINPTVRLRRVTADFLGFSLPFAGDHTDDVTLPNKKYRVLTFFIPIED